MPLSEGRVESGALECMYHGWRFDGGGECVKVPGLCRELSSERGSPRDATRYPCREQQGLIWVYATPGADPDSEPYRLPQADEPGYTTVCQSVDFPGGLLATVENALDVPHTAFLHRGLFRGGGKTNRIEVEVRRGATWAEAETSESRTPRGWSAGSCLLRVGSSLIGIASSCRASPKSSIDWATRTTSW